jgi:rod shape-determining protein MreD
MITFWQRLDSIVRHLAPFATTVLLVVLNAIPLPIPDYRTIVPLVPLMAIFYWAMYRPDLMPVLAVFFIGLLEDVLTGAPLGQNAFVFLATHGIVRGQSRFILGHGFFVVWAVFVMIVAGAGGVSWLVATFLYRGVVPPAPAVAQLALTLAMFPCVAWLLLKVQRAFLVRS